MSLTVPLTLSLICFSPCHIHCLSPWHSHCLTMSRPLSLTVSLTMSHHVTLIVSHRAPYHSSPCHAHCLSPCHAHCHSPCHSLCHSLWPSLLLTVALSATHLHQLPDPLLLLADLASVRIPVVGHFAQLLQQLVNPNFVTLQQPPSGPCTLSETSYQREHSCTAHTHTPLPVISLLLAGSYD